MDDVVLYHPNSYDQTFVAESGDLFEGDVVSVQFRPFEADAERHRAGRLPRVDGQAGQRAEPSWRWSAGSTPSLAFDGPAGRRARSSTARSVTAATNAITDYTAGGLLAARSTGPTPTRPYTADDPADRTARECAGPGEGRGRQVRAVRLGRRSRGSAGATTPRPSSSRPRPTFELSVAVR